MKKILLSLALLTLATGSVLAQGFIHFTTGAASTSRISTNTIANGGTVGQTIGSGGQFIYALYVSATATSVNGQATSISGNTNSNYVFNDPAWTFVGYGTNTAVSGKMLGMNETTNSNGTVVPGVAGGTSARFVVMGWSASIGNSIASVQSWFNLGTPVSDGWLGQSAVSSSLQLGDGGLYPTPALFGAGSLSGFLLGRVAGGLYAPPSITLHPTNQTVSVGGTASFTVTADGDLSLSLAAQWRLNGANINAGGNYSITSTNYPDYPFFTRRGIFTLTVTNTQLTNAGNFPS